MGKKRKAGLVLVGEVDLGQFVACDCCGVVFTPEEWPSGTGCPGCGCFTREEGHVIGHIWDDRYPPF